MTTRDKKATGKISYVTLGWSLKRENKPIGKTESVRVKLEQYCDSVEDPTAKGYIYSYFRIGKEEIYNRIMEKYPAWADELYRNGGDLYLDAIMTVKDGTKCRGSMSYDGSFSDASKVYEKLDGIKGAEKWADSSALDSHYNKTVYFPGNPAMLDREPVKTEEVEEIRNGSLIQEKELPDVNELYLSSDIYKVENAIPSGKSVNLDSSFEQYIYQAVFLHYTGTFSIPVTAKTTYTLVWDDEEHHEETVKVTEFYDVTRSYSYWRVKDVSLYYLYQCEVENQALVPTTPVSGSTTTCVIENNKIPTVNCLKDQSEYLKIPEATVEIDGGKIYGGENRPYIPFGKMGEQADHAVGQIQVNNDGFTIDTDCYLKAGWSEKESDGPTNMMEQRRVDFSKEELYIAPETRNGSYETVVTAHYRLLGGEEEKQFCVNKTNGIKVHTPVVCKGSITDEKKFNQQVVPTSYSSLILGRNFTVSVSAIGEHIAEQGYGIRDYNEFVKEYQISFPFDVYYDTQYIAKNNWIKIKKGSTTFFLPEDVEEGDYQICYRTLAINQMEPALMEEGANLNPVYDTAAVKVPVTIVGRLYDFQITNVIDYPRWQSVFWKANQTERTGNVYYAGINDLNGEKKRDGSSVYLCPILKGSHPYRKNAGPVGLGYQVEFSLTSIGRKTKKKNGLNLSPTFYYVKEDGTDRQKVKIYEKKTLAEIRMPFTFKKQTADYNVLTRQIWTGTCQITPDIYVVPAKIDFKKYLQNRGGRVDTKDPIFLQGGYLVINTAFTLYQGEEAHLSYRNIDNAWKGYCDMWKTEGYQTRRVDSTGVTFLLEEGDTFVFDLTNTISWDYESYGTH